MSGPISSRARLAIGSTLAALVLALTAPPASGAGFELDLHRSGDFVAQTNDVQCVGASVQMMVNMIAERNDRSAATQLRYQNIARAYSRRFPMPFAAGERRGASVRGWAAALNHLGYGPYRVQGYATIELAVHAAAEAIRRTGRPVGLLVWRGRHAWVMSGFEATADPRTTDRFEVTHVRVLDPLYPSVSRTWGAAPAPGRRLSIRALGADFLPRRHSSRAGALGGKYVLVLPVEPPGIRPAGHRAV